MPTSYETFLVLVRVKKLTPSVGYIFKYVAAYEQIEELGDIATKMKANDAEKRITLLSSLKLLKDLL